MYKPTILNNAKNILWICLIMVWGNAAMGQAAESLNGDMGKMMSYLRGGYEQQTVSCRTFLNDTGMNNVYYKKILMTNYEAPDSLLAHIHYMGKNIWTFNSGGLETSHVEYDTTGKCTDSTQVSYDNNNEIAKKVNYRRTQKEALTKAEAETMIRNSKGQLERDSVWSKGADMEEGNYIHSIRVTYYKYDNSGNCISQLTLKNKDTESVFLYKYDSKNRVVAEKRKLLNRRTDIFKKYGNGSDVTEETTINPGDTVRKEMTYDAKDRLLTYDKYKNSQLVTRGRYAYNKDGSYTYREDNYAMPAGAALKPIHEISITDVDRYQNVASKTVQFIRGNDTASKYIRHNYMYTPAGKIGSDTETIGMKQQHGGRTVQVNNVYTYYADGKTLKEEKLGLPGGGYMDATYGSNSQVLDIMRISANGVIEATVEYEK